MTLVDANRKVWAPGRVIAAGLVAAGVALAMTGLSHAEEAEIFLGNDSQMWGQDPSGDAGGNQQENHLARCLADPNDRTSCYLARTKQNDGGLESALEGQLETVILDFSDDNKGVVSKSSNAGADLSEPTGQAAGVDGPPEHRRSAGLAMLEANVFFNYNADTVRPSETQKIDQLAAALNHNLNRDGTFLIMGHTDAKGSETFNCSLATRRANAVAQGLAVRGVAPDRLVVVGAGEYLLKNAYDAGAAENRRVGFAKLGDDTAQLLARLLRLCAGS